MKSKNTIRRVSVRRKGNRDVVLHPSLWALLVACLLVVLMAISRGVVQASDENGPGMPTVTSGMFSPTPATTENSTWEPAALRDLADSLDWPSTVTRESTGRLVVQQVLTGTEWLKASIRPLDFAAAASAAFEAEQEDARLAGYTISQDNFHTFPAYWATITDGRGEIVERRLHWRADAWILGVDIRALEPSVGRVQTISEQLLAFALEYGLPAPQAGGGATPTSSPSASATPTTQATPCGITFSDVPSGFWADEYISNLACRGVISGYSDGSFRPENPTTRGQIVKMIVSSQGWHLVRPRVPTFTDISVGHTFYRYIETAVAHGIINGYPGKTFRSDEYVTRAQVAKIVALARGWTPSTGEQVALCDVPASHWASSYVQSAIERGIFTGYGDGCFYPDAYATRAQLAKVLVLSGR